MKKVAINGFGRIGRTFMRMAYAHPDFEIVAINDLGDIKMLEYLLKYDTAYGRAPFTVENKDGALVINGKTVKVFSEKDPNLLPWGAEGVDIVVEATGFFNTYEKANAHITAGAKRVVITGPVSGTAPEGITGATVLMGVNEGDLATCSISSNASCTTNATSPLSEF